MTAALAALYAQTGLATIAFVLAVILAFAYMMRLVMVARERTREYANLSWGVLSALIRTLDERDKRAARHCAAVAKFSRDIAAHVGMAERDQELAHTAGLLHDIGRFALSDRVMERGAGSTRTTGRRSAAIPSIGADLLKDIGVYGPVAEIVLAHHERIDGRGYPRAADGRRDPGDRAIVAVAEVYDTLTAPDTYRTQMNSFEALTELRRVAGQPAGRPLRRGARGAARRPGHGVPPCRRRRLRRRAGHRAADERGRRVRVRYGEATKRFSCSSDARNASSCSTEKRRWPPGVR